MLDRVLDQQLQQHRWQGRAERRFINVAFEAQSLLVVHFLDGQIVVDDFEFAPQRHTRGIAVIERMPQRVRQLCDHEAGALGVFIDQRTQVVQGVEHEVGIEAGTKCVQFERRCRGLGAQP